MAFFRVFTSRLPDNVRNAIGNIRGGEFVVEASTQAAAIRQIASKFGISEAAAQQLFNPQQSVTPGGGDSIDSLLLRQPEIVTAIRNAANLNTTKQMSLGEQQALAAEIFLAQQNATAPSTTVPAASGAPEGPSISFRTSTAPATSTTSATGPIALTDADRAIIAAQNAAGSQPGAGSEGPSVNLLRHPGVVAATSGEGRIIGSSGGSILLESADGTVTRIEQDGTRRLVSAGGGGNTDPGNALANAGIPPAPGFPAGTSPTGGTSTVSNTGAGVGSSFTAPPPLEQSAIGELPLIDRGTQFREFLRAGGINPNSTAGSILGRFAGPAEGTFDISTALGMTTTPVDANNPFQRFLGANNLRNISSQGLGTFRALLGGNVPELAQAFVNPAAGTAASAALQDLAQAALGGSTNRGFANRFGDELIDRLRLQFRDLEQTSPQTAGTFAQALALGLGIR